MLTRCTTLLALLVFGVLTCAAQGAFFRLQPNQPANFFTIVENANAYFADKHYDDSKKFTDNEFIKFKRWEWYWSTRINEDGSFPDLMTQKRIYDDLNASLDQRDLESPWININQTVGDGGYNGMGRLTSIAFHPTDPDIFYVGAPIGGVWKTIDGGQHWTALGDDLPFLSVGNVCIDHTNPDVLYITIGDHSGWWNYGLGVYKSIDAGQTWQPTSHTTTFNNEVAYLRMTINPLNANELFVAQTDGLYRTQDAGETWTLIHDGHHSDVVFQPGSNTTLYASTDDYWGSSEVYVSYDNGDTWMQLTDFNQQYASIHLTVTPDDDQYLGIQHNHDGVYDFYLSTDGGITLETPSNLPEDGIIFFSPTDKNRMFCGWMNVYKSFDAGWQWEQNTMWYNDEVHHEVHADQRNVAYHPLTNEIFFCNDGGLYKYNEDTDDWTDLSNGLIITQYYRIAVSQQSETFMIGGTQDNGGRKRIGSTTWAATNGGDAMEVAIDYTDDNILYTTYINGQLYRSTDQWNNDVYYEITPEQSTGGAWVTPYIIDPNDPSVLIAGYEEVFKSFDQGDSWVALTSNLTGSTDNKLDAVAVAPSNSDYIYAARNAKLYMTADGGENWVSYNAYPGGTYGATITSIVVHPFDPLQLWITVGGYQSTNKVRYSADGGDTFVNITENLPNTPINCSVIDKESPNLDLYIGTDAGVFIWNTVDLQWDYYGMGMPNTSVTDLEIQYSGRKLRAGTFGRGIYENDLYSEPGVNVNNREEAYAQWASIAHNPANNILVLNVHASTFDAGQVYIYDLTGKQIATHPIAITPGNYQRTFSIENLPAGTYLVSIDAVGFSRKAITLVVC
ncbi:MAG: T9SS type A sorting domain-containing protein [Flavobacteriales bacterium]